MDHDGISGDDEGTQASPVSRALGWVGAFALLLVLAVLFMHVFAPTITRDEAAPPGHSQSACIACHIVTGSAEGESQ